ncbi:IncF plasmid conjugative transfer pilus assemblyprotein TraC [Bathymodiolus heckerae thiotrophic gill symbiont]|uniref:TraC family protein n=1 Tax=Bathymodiolus heckerae thiotrophic gill symbiont TaxID=1052212 RepID=UPI0010B5AD37|nr:TraC family protein [Bathymodiolus heckerae thiotrophic gill symbiont]SHN89535.1 IncF plasmid conjugative transfer pilus assemblyprotein TraC [Bathymodiolus heckerae thiotrophic gill symbiont]
MKQFNSDLQRDKLSDYLPWLAYDTDNQVFINTDDTHGYLFECSSLYFSGDKSINTLTSMIKQDYGKGAVLQFILFADTNITNHCDQVKAGDIRQTPLTQKMSDYHTKFLQNPDKYQAKTKGNKLKNFRLFVALKTQNSLDKMSISAFTEALAGAGLNPSVADPSQLLSLARQLLNGSKNNQTHYDELKPIAKQAIFADTTIDFSHKKFIKINDEFISVITPKTFPDQMNKEGLTSEQISQLTGEYKGGMGDMNQISSRFIWSCNILLDKVSRELQLKSEMANLQRMGAKQKNNIADRISILDSAVKGINKDHYLKFIPSMVIFSDSENELSASSTKAIRLWEAQGFLMQQENTIKHIVFLQSLPFGLYLGKKNRNIGFLDRHFIAKSESIAAQLPIQADYKGFGLPIVPFVGRKGQVQGLDLYSKGANNHNFLCCANSGSGKSFLIIHLLANYFAAGAKIRINDIGGSYKKIASLFDGVYIDIADNSINLNPFQTPHNLNKQYEELNNDDYDEVDKEHDLETITMVLGEMVYSNTEDGKLTGEETGLLMHAVKEAVARGIVKDSIDFIQHYLNNLNEFSNNKTAIPESLYNRAKEMAFTLCEFTSKGEYGYLFNSESENTWQDNPFVVLELESLSSKPALMKVVSLQMINMMTQEMYQGDRSEKKISIFDEVAFMFGSSQRLAKVVEDGYRRARKYNGSFGTIFQSILDTQLFGRVGEVMNNNAAFKFYLESGDYEKALKQGVITLDDFSAKLLKGIKSNRPHYSEIFMDTPGGVGVSRLMLGEYGYAVATTDANEVAEIDSYIDEGLPIDEVLEKFASKRGLNK